MRFLHLSDLHFGVKLNGMEMRSAQDYVFNQIFEQVKLKQPDAILIAGDVFNVADPNADAIEDYQTFVNNLNDAAPNAHIMVVSGNHDNMTRLNQYRAFLRRLNLHMIGRPPMREGEYIEKTTLYDEHGPVNFYLLPFVKPGWIREIVGTDDKGNNLDVSSAVVKLIERENVDETQRNVIISHQYYKPFSGERTPDDAEYLEMTMGNEAPVDGNVLKRFDYAALGHIHKPSKIGDEFHRYCGTPTIYSVNELGQEKAALWIDMGAKGDIAVTREPLKPLHEMKKFIGTLPEVLKQRDDSYAVIELQGQNDLEGSASDLLRNAFPNLIKFHWIDQVRTVYSGELVEEELNNPYELCLKFLEEDELNDDYKKILKEIVDVAEEQVRNGASSK